MKTAALLVLAAAVGSCNRSSSSERPAADSPVEPKTPPTTKDAGAGPADKPMSTPVTATNETDGIELSWSLAGDADKLAIDYTIRNKSDAKIWVADQLLQNTAGGREMKLAGRLIARNGDRPEIVSFVLGMTYESMQRGRERPAPSPAMKPIEPGGEHSGHAEIPLPLKAWHNYGTLEPLAGDKRQAVFEVTYIDDPGDPKAFWQVPVEGAGKVPAPSPAHLKDNARRLTSTPLALP